MKKRRNLLLLIIALGLVALSATLGGVYAYWQGTVSAPEEATTLNKTVTIGESRDHETTLSVTGDAVNENIVLVPVGKKEVSKAPEEKTIEDNVVYNVTVNWEEKLAAEEAAALEAGSVSATLTIEHQLSIDGVDQAAVDRMFTVEISPEIAAEGADIQIGVPLEFTITVTFAEEPENQAEYDLVKTKNLQLDLTFTVSVA